jgi:hypothetical protein
MHNIYAMKTLALLLLSCSLYAQEFQPSTQFEVIGLVNNARAMYGIWRANDIERYQPRTDSVAMLLFRTYRDKETNDQELEYFIKSKEYLKKVGTFENGISIDVFVCNDKSTFLKRCRDTFVSDNSRQLNPLAYHVSVSVVSEGDKYFCVVSMYR